MAVGASANASGWRSTAIGSETNAAIRSVAIGYGADANGDGGVAIGYDVQISGSKSMAIGSGVDAANPLTNSTSNSLVLGFNDTDALLFAGGPNKRVGIGTTVPEELLDVEGTVQADGLKLPTGATDGYVLTSDAAGVATWQEGGGSGLTLPYAGESGEDGNIFHITTSSAGPAIAGLQSEGGSLKLGHLGDAVAGVVGVNLATGDRGWLGTDTHAGHFDGDVEIINGTLSIGDPAPQAALNVAGTVTVESDTLYMDSVVHVHYTGGERNGAAVFGQSDAAGMAGGSFQGYDVGSTAETSLGTAIYARSREPLGGTGIYGEASSNETSAIGSMDTPRPLAVECAREFSARPVVGLSPWLGSSSVTSRSRRTGCRRLQDERDRRLMATC